MEALSSNGLRVPPSRRVLQAETMAERSWRTAELAAALQSRRPALQLGRAISKEQRVAIDRCEVVRAAFPLRQLPPLAQVEPSKQALSATHRLAAVVSAAAGEATGDGAPRWVLREGRDGGFWSRKKRPQLLYMTEQVRALLEDHPHWGHRPLHIADIGGGQGFFAEHLARTFGERVRVSLIEIDGKRLQQAQKRMGGAPAAARSRKRRATQTATGKPGGNVSGVLLDNLDCVEGDAAALAAVGRLKDIDVAVGLHACGGLSDLIIRHAVEQGAAFAVCTCCFYSHRQLPMPGEVSRLEWLTRGFTKAARPPSPPPPSPPSPSPPPPSPPPPSPPQIELLMRTAELTGRPRDARASAHAVNAMRAAAAEVSWADAWGGLTSSGGAAGSHPQHGGQGRVARGSTAGGEGGNKEEDTRSARTPTGTRPARLVAEVLQYDAKFSPRNMVIVGRPQWG